MSQEAFHLTDVDPRTVRRLTGESGKGVLVSGDKAAVGRALRILDSMARQEERDRDLLEVLLRDVEPGTISSEHLAQLHVQAEVRHAFLTKVPLLRSEDVGALLGSRARNRSAMASRLKGDGSIFAVTHRGLDLFPGFQFVGGEVHPAVGKILAAFEGESPWTVALWLDAPSGWLGGDRPLDIFGDDPERVVAAAERTAEPIAV
jgi:hypothetical protein